MGERAPLRRIVIDAAVPSREADLLKLANDIYSVPGVRAVRVTVNEVDMDVLGLIIVVEGDGFAFERVRRAIEENGGVIHSIDEVVVGEYIPLQVSGNG